MTSILILPRRVNNSWTVGLTKAEVSPSVFTPLSPSVFTPHQILYSPSLNNCTVHGFCCETSVSVPLRLHFISAVSRESVSTGVCLRDPVYKQRFFVARYVRHLQAFILVQLCNKLTAGILIDAKRDDDQVSTIAGRTIIGHVERFSSLDR